MSASASDEVKGADERMSDEEFVLWLRAMPNVHAALYHLRAMQRLTQQEVADLAGVSRAYVTHVERGERRPERDTLVAILLAALSLPVPQANRILLLAGYAPMHHLALAHAQPRAKAIPDEVRAERRFETPTHTQATAEA